MHTKTQSHDPRCTGCLKIVRTKIVKTPHETEWVVKVWVANHLLVSGEQRYEPADYFASDKQDAIDTAKLMMEGK